MSSSSEISPYFDLIMEGRTRRGEINTYDSHIQSCQNNFNVCMQGLNEGKEIAERNLQETIQKINDYKLSKKGEQEMKHITRDDLDLLEDFSDSAAWNGARRYYLAEQGTPFLTDEERREKLENDRQQQQQDRDSKVIEENRADGIDINTGKKFSTGKFGGRGKRSRKQAGRRIRKTKCTRR